MKAESAYAESWPQTTDRRHKTGMDREASCLEMTSCAKRQPNCSYQLTARLSVSCYILLQLVVDVLVRAPDFVPRTPHLRAWPFQSTVNIFTGEYIRDLVHRGNTTIDRPRLPSKPNGIATSRGCLSAGQDRDKLEVPNKTISLAPLCPASLGISSRDRRCPVEHGTSHPPRIKD